jgi:tetratricopeptide (TPR) repeat protein
MIRRVVKQKGDSKVRRAMEASGASAVAAQAEHSSATAAVGAESTLTLVPPASRVPIAKAPSALEYLNPYRRAIPLIGRDRDLSSLLSWLTHPGRRISVRVLVGGAGSGKTRLAIELIEKLGERSESKWDARFASALELRRFSQEKPLAHREWEGPTLIVVDHAAMLSQPLGDWLRMLAQKAARDCPPLRILLLEREAGAEGEWLSALLEDGPDPKVRELFDPVEPQILRAIEAGAGRRELLASTISICAKSTGRPAPRIPGEGEDPAFDQRLAEAQWGDPLYLMMAGLLASYGENLPCVLELSRSALADEVVKRELDRLDALVATDGERKLLRRVAGWVALAGGMSRQQASRVVRQESRLLGLDLRGGPDAFIDALLKALPGSDYGVGRISPDLIAEALALRVFAGLSDSEQGQLIRRALSELGHDLVAPIVRTAQDFALLVQPTALRWLDVLIETAAGEDGTLLDLVERAMPHDTVALRDHAAQVALLVVERVRGELGESDDEMKRAELARRLNNLATRLSATGRREEALQSARQAVELYRSLAQANPRVALPNLATSLSNLANMLNDMGQGEEALQSAQQAADLYRSLAEARPSAYLPGLASTLNNLANMLSDLGRREEALQSAQQAVTIRRGLAEVRREAFLPKLAKSLHSLANIRSELGQRTEALEVAQEAVDLYRSLAQARPDAFLPDLAMSLDSLANMLSDLGRRKEAFEVSQEAVDLYRPLAQARPDAFLPDLARSLHNLAPRISDSGQYTEALGVAQEAVTVYQQLAQVRPGAFLPRLAASLTNLAPRLAESGQRKEALEVAQEAVDLYRLLAHACPDAFLSNLAASLTNLTPRLGELGRYEEGLTAAEEAVRLYRQMAQARPAAFLPDLATSLSNLANMLSDLGWREEALQTVRQVVRVRRSLAESCPDAFLPDLATSLNNLANMLSDAGQRREALQIAREAVRLCRQLAESRPDVLRESLARALWTLGDILLDEGEAREAVKSFADGLSALTPLLRRSRPDCIRLAGVLKERYLTTAQKSGAVPDVKLLTPVVKALRKMAENQQ